MASPRNALVKVCGVTNAEDARIAVDAGADFLGFIFAPSKRRVTPSKVKAILREVKGAYEAVGVFVHETLSRVNEIIEETGISYVQLHDDESDAYAAKVNAKIIRTIRVKDASSFAAIERYTRYDILLFDTYTEAYGGAGKRFNWDLLRGREEDYFLAGGLTPDNVYEALTQTNAKGVDVSSGLEATPGKKDAKKVRTFIRIAHGVNV